MSCWREVNLLGNTGWRPTMPASKPTRSGNVVTLTLRTPYGHPVTIDTTTLPLQSFYGFEYRVDEYDQTPNLIQKVEMISPTGVFQITLNEAVSGYLSYAWTSTGAPRGNTGNPNGRPGAWGNIRDTDPTPSVSIPGRELPNWLVCFQEAIA